jgi:hypothetical protein
LKNNLNAITLVESVLYLALFGIFFVIVIQFAFSIGQQNTKSELDNTLNRGIIFINEHLNDDFINALSEDSALSTFGNDNGVLRLNMPASKYAQYSISSGRLQFSDNGTTYFLTPLELTVNQFLLTRINNAAGTSVGAQLTLTMSSTKYTEITDTYSTSYVLK